MGVNIVNKIKNIPVRFWMITMIFFTSFMGGILRSNITFVIGSMATRSNKKLVPYCLRQGKKSLWMNVEVPDHGPRYNWSYTTEWHISVAYYYGVLLSSPSSGLLAEILGPKHTILWPLLIAGLSNAFIAHGAAYHWMVPFSCSFLVGCATGLAYPSMMSLIARWSPPKERGKFLSAVIGHSIGVSVMWTFLHYTLRFIGWQATFYIVAVLMILYCTAFFLLTANSPEEHRFIKEQELEFIKSTQGHLVSIKKELPPYKEIASSSNCWALLILHFGYRWCNQINFILVPIFITDFMGASTSESILLTILPQVSAYCGAVIFGNLSDIIQSREFMSVTIMTKSFVVFSHMLSGCIIMCTGMVQCYIVASTILNILSNFLGGACVATNLRNTIDIAPNCAATIYGLNSGLAATSCLIIPILYDWILSSSHGILHWTILFLISGLIPLATGLIFLFFGDSEIQYWNAKRGKGFWRVQDSN